MSSWAVRTWCKWCGRKRLASMGSVEAPCFDCKGYTPHRTKSFVDWEEINYEASGNFSSAVAPPVSAGREKSR